MLDGFHDVQFPLSVSLGSRGGPVRRTDVIRLTSGHEQRIARSAQSRRQYNAGYGIRCTEDIEDIIAFFEARQGRQYAFRWRDPFDHQTAPKRQSVTALDQNIATGDGQQTVFQLQKHYLSGEQSYTRPIHLPVGGYVLIAIDGVDQTEGVDFTVDTQSGEITFASAPTLGSVITAGCIFDIPVRFDTDELILSVEAGGGEIADIPIIEVLV